MLLVLLLACFLVLFAAFRSSPGDVTPVSWFSEEEPPAEDREKESEKKSRPLKFRKTGKETKKGSGRLSEEEAVKLILGRALAEHDTEETQVDRSSGRILDENEEACLVGFDIVRPQSADRLHTEVYWIQGKTLRVKDLCSLQEYRPGMIDITKGELAAASEEKEAERGTDDQRILPAEENPDLGRPSAEDKENTDHEGTERSTE